MNIEHELKALRKSFSFDFSFMLVMAFEIVYAITLWTLSNPFPFLDWLAGDDITNMVWNQAAMVTQEAVTDANLAAIEGYLTKLILVFVGYFIVHSLLYGVFGYLSWHRMADKHFDLKHARGFVKISALWVFCWLIGFSFLVAIMEPWSYYYLIIISVVLFLHTTTMLNIVLIHNRKHCEMGFKEATTRALHMSVRKLKHCPVSLSSGVIAVIAGGIALSLIGTLMPSLERWVPEILVLYFAAFITWWRTHLYHLLKEHTKTREFTSA